MKRFLEKTGNKERYAMLAKSNKQASGFSVMNADELFSINGGDGNATKYTYPDGSYMIVSNDGSFDTAIYNSDGTPKIMDGMCGDVSNAIPSDVNYDPNTGIVTNPVNNSNSSNNEVSHSGNGGSSGGKA